MKTKPDETRFRSSASYRRLLGLALRQARVELRLSPIQVLLDLDWERIEWLDDLEWGNSGAVRRMRQLTEYLGVEDPEADAAAVESMA